MSGDVMTGTGDTLGAEVETKRLHMGGNDPLSKGHQRYDKHMRQKESDFEKFAGEGPGMQQDEGVTLGSEAEREGKDI